MKRMMIATALVTTLGTSAFAANETQIELIDSFAAGIDTSVMTDAELDAAYGIVSSGMSRGEKVAKLRSLQADPDLAGPAMLGEADRLSIAQYAPEADLDSITRQQAQTALSVIASGESEGDKSRAVQAILADTSVAVSPASNLTYGQLDLIRTYAPDVDAADLTETDVLQLLSVIHSASSRSEKLAQITSILNS